ncbi:MAG: hypothetical protein J6W29_02970, partial [Neisseriaceae bacterium]|nr:hypothetical protein [Neisseriaceae bacterium]
QKKQAQKNACLISKEIFCCKKVIHKVIHNFYWFSGSLKSAVIKVMKNDRNKARNQLILSVFSTH